MASVIVVAAKDRAECCTSLLLFEIAVVAPGDVGAIASSPGEDASPKKIPL
jgi:hypothetical protein